MFQPWIVIESWCSVQLLFEFLDDKDDDVFQGVGLMFLSPTLLRDFIVTLLFVKDDNWVEIICFVIFRGSYLNFIEDGKEQTTKLFPRRESNPGRGGESAES